MPEINGKSIVTQEPLGTVKDVGVYVRVSGVILVDVPEVSVSVKLVLILNLNLSASNTFLDVAVYLI